MKILFIADILPDLTSGSAVRNYHFLHVLKKNHQVDFVGLTDNTKSGGVNQFKILSKTILMRKKISIIKKIKYLIENKIPYIEQRRNISLPDSIVKILPTYDFIHLAELNSFFLIEKYIKYIHGSIILDAHNVEYFRLRGEIKNKPFFFQLMGGLFLNTIKKIEIKSVNLVDQILICSDVDQVYFKTMCPNISSSFIPNGVDIIERKNTNVNKKNKIIILFMGLLSYSPNQDALKYYLKDIHPIISQKIPNMEFHILGKNTPNWLIEQSKNDKTIKILGFVHNTRHFINKADICIAPLLSGSGTRIKILEYMGMKKPVVASTKGVEGIDVKNGDNILIANNPLEFQNAIILLCKNTFLSKKIGENGFILVKNKYNWKIIYEKINKIYRNNKI